MGKKGRHSIKKPKGFGKKGEKPETEKEDKQK